MCSSGSDLNLLSMDTLLLMRFSITGQVGTRKQRHVVGSQVSAAAS